VGPSGIGKTSVVAAGLVPHLEGIGGWRLFRLRIGADPFRAFADTLLPPDPISSERISDMFRVAAGFETGQLKLRDFFDHYGGAYRTNRILIIVDQFEEVFTRIERSAVRERFIDFLLGDFRNGSPEIHLLLVLRAEFYGLALMNRRLANAMVDGVENLGPMGVDELRAAITLPAEMANVSFEAGAVEALLEDIERTPSNLGLLQFALLEAWQRQQPYGTRIITLQSLAEVGGVEGALGIRAEKIFQDLTKDGQGERVFAQVFSRLVEMRDEEVIIRHAAARGEFADEVWPFIQHLARSRLLIITNRESDTPTIELANESLLRYWPRLAHWIEDNRSFLSWYRRIRPNIDLWLANSTDDDLLLRGTILDEAAHWLAAAPERFSEREIAYIQASVAQHGREQMAVREARAQREEILAEANRIARKQTRNARLLTTALFVTTIVLSSVLLIRLVEGQKFELPPLAEIRTVPVASAFTIVIWALTLLALYWLYPGRLVRWHEAFPEPSGIKEATSALDKITLGTATILYWIAKSSILFLGTSRRALDDWVEAHVGDYRAPFISHPIVRDRKILIDLPVKINGRPNEEPWSELKRLVSRDAPMSILIAGPGGVGKTTLACHIGRRAIEAVSETYSGKNRMLPLLIIDAEVPKEAAKANGFYPFIAGVLRSALNENRRISVPLVKALLRSGRVLLIVDGLTDGSFANQVFDPRRHDFEVRRLVATSRNRILPGMNTLIEVEAIPINSLYDFLDQYLTEMDEHQEGTRPSDDQILYACGDLKRLLGGTPCTPLLATMWAKEIGSPATTGRPRGVMSLIDSYVRRILLPTSSNETFIHRLGIDAAKIAEHQLGLEYRPNYITRAAALDVLRKLSPKDVERRFTLLEKSQILESPSPDSNIVRIAPDPLAEHLVARLRTEEFQGDSADWRKFLGRLRKKGLPAGFVSALAACAEDEVYGRMIPPQIREEIKELRDRREDEEKAA
jgi:hypothetical protein